MDDNPFIIIGIVVLVIFALLFVVVFVVVGIDYLITVNITQANIIKVYESENLVYTGKKAFVNIDSGGMTTTITIYKQLFPFHIIDKIYSNSNMRVEN